MTTPKVQSAPTKGRPLFLSVAEQASELGISEVTLYRAIKAGEFPAVRIPGSRQSRDERSLTSDDTLSR